MWNYNLFYLLIGIILIFWIIIYYNESKQITQINEINEMNEMNGMNKIERFTQGDKKIIYIYWSGGFDSNFLVAQRIIEERAIVQPIYLDFKLDTTSKGSYFRRSRELELESMRKFREILKSKWPQLSNNLLPTLFLKGVKDNRVFTRRYISMKLFIRDISQYKHMASFADEKSKLIEIGSIGLNANSKDKYGKHLRANLVLDDNYPSKHLPTYKHRDSTNPLHNLRYPIIYLSKKWVLERAKRGGYQKLLEISWSCWFPKWIKDHTTGRKIAKRCGKCPMCMERII